MTGGDASAPGYELTLWGPGGPPDDPPDITDIFNLAVPYFGLICIGFACGKAQGAG